jgi:Uma2 family endonuclease
MGAMSSLPEARRFTVAEYLRLAAAGVLRPDEKVEPIDGVIAGMSPQQSVHPALVAQILPPLLDD